MENINKYNEFRFNMLLEAVTRGDQKLVLSDRLLELLLKIEHPIAKQLIESNDEEEKFDITLLDYHDTDIAKFTFTPSNKAILEPQTKNTWSKNRVESRIGKMVVRLYGDKYPNTGSDGVELFVDEIKIARSKNDANFKIVKGKDIIKYYNNKTYAKAKPGSTLSNSCMGYNNCSPYIGFYSKNNIKMLVLFDDDNVSVRGRALLWSIDDINGEELETPRLFMDRIYTIESYEIGKFIEYAKQHSILYKDTQDAIEQNICDPITGESSYLKMVTYDIEKHTSYPFLDTMKFYNSEEEAISNDYMFDYDMSFESTEGGYLSENDGTEYVFSTYSQKFVPSESLTWSEVENRNLVDEEGIEWIQSIKSYASAKYIEEHLFYSMEEHEYFPNYMKVKIEGRDDFVSKNRAYRDYMYSERTKKYYDDEDVKFSYREGNISIPNELAVKVFDYVDLEEDDYDYRYKDSNNYFPYTTSDGKTVFYDDKLKDEFIEVYKNQYSNDLIYMLKDKDKDRYIEKDGRYIQKNN